MKNQYLVIDIETIPCQRQDVREYIAKTVKPPATFKKAESIAAWHKEQGPEAIEEAVSKTGLDGAFGQVCVVGLALDENKSEVIYGLDEAVLLKQLNDKLNAIPASMHNAITLVGHNLQGFDIRFLWQRYVVNGIRPHAIINASVNAKSWDAKVYDTMTQFAGYGNRISLDKLCLALGIESPKGDMDGSMVGQYVADGRIAEVAAYCLKDVAATREAYKRMTFRHIESVCELQTA